MQVQLNSKLKKILSSAAGIFLRKYQTFSIQAVCKSM